MKNVHIGSIIKQKVKESSMTNKEFADRINCERSSVYYIFKQKNVNIDKLRKISEVLNYDFISEVYAGEDNKMAHLPESNVFAIEIDPDFLQQLASADNVVLLIKRKNKC